MDWKCKGEDENTQIKGLFLQPFTRCIYIEGDMQDDNTVGGNQKIEQSEWLIGGQDYNSSGFHWFCQLTSEWTVL